MNRKTLHETPNTFRIFNMNTLKFIKLENLKEMVKFLDSSKPSKLNQDEINSLNRLITNEKIETMFKIQAQTDLKQNST